MELVRSGRSIPSTLANEFLRFTPEGDAPWLRDGNTSIVLIVCAYGSTGFSCRTGPTPPPGAQTLPVPWPDVLVGEFAERMLRVEVDLQPILIERLVAEREDVLWTRIALRIRKVPPSAESRSRLRPRQIYLS